MKINSYEKQRSLQNHLISSPSFFFDKLNLMIFKEMNNYKEMLCFFKVIEIEFGSFYRRFVTVWEHVESLEPFRIIRG